MPAVTVSDWSSLPRVSMTDPSPAPERQVARLTTAPKGLEGEGFPVRRAFAGLTFDVTGALYSHLSVGDPPSAWAPAAIALTLIGGSYVAYRLRRSQVIVSKTNEPGSDRTAAMAAPFGLNA